MRVVNYGVIKKNIRNLRNSLELSLTDFGKRIANSSAATISQWEKGNTLPPASKEKLLTDFCGLPEGEWGNIQLSIDDLQIIKQFYSNEDCMSYFINEPGNIIVSENKDKLIMDFKLFLRFELENTFDPFYIIASLTYEKSSPTIIRVDFDYVIEDSEGILNIDYNKLFVRHSHVYNKRKFEYIIYSALSHVYPIVIKQINESIWGSHDKELPRYNLYIVSEPENNSTQFHLNWPYLYFLKGKGIQYFNDYIKTKYN